MGLLDRVLGKKKKLTKKQRAQRSYAAKMKHVRSRAAKRGGGTGRVASRSTAAALRKKHGLKKKR